MGIPYCRQDSCRGQDVMSCDDGDSRHIPLVPHNQVEQVFADRLFAGVLWCTELCPAMSQRAGQEEALITDQSETRTKTLDQTTCSTC